MKLIMFSVLTLLLLLCNISFARLIQVNTASSFKSACVNAVPGDTVELADGVYNNIGSITMYNSGTLELPILIKAKNIGLAELKGDSYFDFRQCEYITIQGFLFTSTDATVLKLQASNNIRISRNIFRLVETTSLKWIIIGGVWNDPNAVSHHNRVDHNLFENKSFAGNYITIDGSGDPVYLSSEYDLIDHNHFRNIGPRIVNEMETIRVGWSELSRSSGYTTIEYNLFENCDGDPEIISVKTCDNIVRYNTFVSSQGTLSLRHGDRTIVNGNYFFGKGKEGTGGIRFYGDDHIIYNNYFEGLTGNIWDAALTITNGDADYSTSTSWSKHFRPRNTVIAFNTFVNNLHNIEIGYTNNGSYSKAPSNNLIANNIVQGSVNNLIHIYTQPINMGWESNIMFPTDIAVLGISASYEQIKQIDPLLTEIDSLWFISGNSPAIDSATGLYDYVTDDFNGQQRVSPKDIGADEYSNDSIIRKPLTANDVGPFAEEMVTSVETGLNVNLNPDSFILYQNYPNPFNPYTTIRYSVPLDGLVSLAVYNLIGEKVAQLVNTNLSVGNYQANFDATNLTSGVYFYRIQANSFLETKKMILLK